MEGERDEGGEKLRTRRERQASGGHLGSRLWRPLEPKQEGSEPPCCPHPASQPLSGRGTEGRGGERPRGSGVAEMGVWLPRSWGASGAEETSGN